MEDKLDSADQRNLLAVRTRLWQDRAVVMVGAGFSRSAAVPIAGEVPPLPLWEGLAERMREELYRESKGGPEPLRLAQEYQAAFGPAVLYALIADLIPDARYVPGPMQRELLRLPWVDVYTTNYDTLLERAAQASGRRYEVVYEPADLPQRKAPRIVKLHGSLPSHRPLIITEEDFRRYPQERAPFVGLVQSALMEHAFFLLGFSGDDPNFLAWTGWVRDHLGGSAPPMYLAGWFDMPAHRRQLLEERGVRPIDLAPLLPNSRWADPDERHAVAAAWLIESLANGQPSNPINWPGPYPPAKLKEALLPPHAPRPLPPSEYLPEPAPPSSFRLQMGRAHRSKADLSALWRVWRQEWKVYPGWIVAPHRIRKRALEEIDDRAGDVRNGAEDLSSVEQIALLREYVWRHNLALITLSEAEVALVERALGRVNPAPHRIKLSNAEASPPREIEKKLELEWAEVHEGWVELALSVLRHARHNLDRERWKRWEDLVERAVAGQAYATAHLHYERCLFALAELDRPMAEAAVKAWPSALDAFPFGEVWRAGVLAELGLLDKAVETAHAALNGILAAQVAAAKPSIALLSAEGWTRQLIAFVEWGLAVERRDYQFPDYSWQRRLRHDHCDPSEELDRLETQLEGEPPGPQESVQRKKGFDPGSVRYKQRLFISRYKRDDHAPGLSALLMAEGAGLPFVPLGRAASSWDRLIERGAAWARPLAPWQALAAHFRRGISSIEKALAVQYFGRMRLAGFDEITVDRLCNWLLRGAESGKKWLQQHTPNERTHPATRQLALVLEALSRIAFRLSDEVLERLVQYALSLMQLRAVQRDFELHESLANLLKRVLRNLSDERLEKLLDDILGAPIRGFDFEAAGWDKWPEPGRYLTSRSVKPASPEPDLVSWLLRALQSEHGSAKAEALRRLRYIYRRGMLEETEQSRMAEALWPQSEGAKLPNIPFFPEHLLLGLPEPADGVAEQALKAHLLGNESGESLEPLSEDAIQTLYFSSAEV